MKKAIRLIEGRIEWTKRQLLAEQDTTVCLFKKQMLSRTILKWTAPKTYLKELIYGFDELGCFNSGNVSLNQIVVYFEEVFNINLAYFAQDFYEMRIRNDRTPCLDMLKKLVIMRMDNPKLPHKKRNRGLMK